MRVTNGATRIDHVASVVHQDSVWLRDLYASEARIESVTDNQAIVAAMAEACGSDLNTVFSEREIAVIVWRRFPERFGIPGYKQYPCTKKVSCLLFRRIGPRSLGWLVRVGAGKWQLTQAGLDMVVARGHIDMELHGPTRGTVLELRNTKITALVNAVNDQGDWFTVFVADDTGLAYAVPAQHWRSVTDLPPIVGRGVKLEVGSRWRSHTGQFCRVLVVAFCYSSAEHVVVYRREASNEVCLCSVVQWQGYAKHKGKTVLRFVADKKRE